MCKDVVTGEFFRADHLVKTVLEARLQAAINPQHTADTGPESPYPRRAEEHGDPPISLATNSVNYAVVAEYTDILAKVRLSLPESRQFSD